MPELLDRRRRFACRCWQTCPIISTRCNCLAVKFASQPDYLSALRSELAARVLASPSGNTKNYTRAAEAAYRAIWQQYCVRKQQGAAP